MKKVKILFKFPTRERPEIFKQTLSIWQDNLSGEYDYRFLVTLDSDDSTMNNPDMRKYMDGRPNLEYKFGEHASKIDAVNADMKDEDFDILVLVSDDMLPRVKQYDKIIVQMMEKYFPDMDGALHFHDGLFGKDNTITLSIMGKKLYDYFGYIYHPDYKSFYCDNEFTDQVRKLKKVVYCPTIIVKHGWQKYVGKDALYKKNSKKGKQDSATYARRKDLGFPI